MQVQILQFPSTPKYLGRSLAAFLLVLLFSHQAKGQTTAQPVQAEHRRKVMVSIPHRKLALIENGQVKKVYPVAVGSHTSPSPTGRFEVKTRLTKPTYYHPGKVIPAGPDNPLGTRWIGLSTKGYGIHGTNVESSIGKAASHGCIRMHRQDLEELFADLQVGDQVEIRAAADPEVDLIFGKEPAAEQENDGVLTAVAAEPAQQ
jgi:lipoprotein-anchoring transpeptidase ErfK/SrfK